jgi:16S rRNA C967 or C1407 C5-methylase (RsmB/RsmF family)/NOL1/NOP2/fmu family ribosome biogenesis protein
LNDLRHIIQSFENAPGFETEKFLSAHSEPAVNSFRINRKKISQSPFENAVPVPWCMDGFYLKERPAYAMHPYWHGGAIYVQEASSMFLHHALKQLLDTGSDLCVLDACAAPGGKSTLIASLLGKNSVLVSNEVIRSRVNVLQENIVKWGNANSIITSSDTQQFSKLPNLFDCIVIDAPCSGSGLFRKDAEAMNEWSEENVKLCGERQTRIVSNLLPSLKPGGVLVYSTCSFSVEENEAIVEMLCNEHSLDIVEVPVAADWNIVNSAQGCYRFYPYRLQGEGFFVSFLRKKEGEEKPVSIPNTIKPVKPDPSFTQYLQSPEHFFTHNEAIFAATKKTLETSEVLKQHKINLVQCGVEIGAQKGNKFIPSHALALNELLNRDIVCIDLDETTALNYLRKQTIALDSDPGYKIIRYNGVNLGWVNVLQNRINNMYPTNWRLLR